MCQFFLKQIDYDYIALFIWINRQNNEDVDQFVHLGSLFFCKGDTELNVVRRINSIESVFALLSKIWKLNYYHHHHVEGIIWYRFLCATASIYGSSM